MTVFEGFTKVQPYAVIDLDVTVARTDTAQGPITLLGESVSDWMANTITLFSLGGDTVNFRLDDATAGSIPASDGMKVEGIPFTEIYWTTAGLGATAYILIAWVD